MSAPSIGFVGAGRVARPMVRIPKIAEAVQDLVPVKPLAEAVGMMTVAYGAVLPGLHAKLTRRSSA